MYGHSRSGRVFGDKLEKILLKEGWTDTSLSGTEYLRRVADEDSAVGWNRHESCLQENRRHLKSLKSTEDMPIHKRAIERAVKFKTSSLLNAGPINHENWGLSPQEAPENCDGWGEAFNLDHGLNRHTGGLVDKRTKGHDEIRDSLADISSMACGSHVQTEPLLDIEREKEHKLDILIRGGAGAQTTAIIVIVCINARGTSNWPCEKLFRMLNLVRAGSIRRSALPEGPKSFPLQQ